MSSDIIHLFTLEKFFLDVSFVLLLLSEYPDGYLYLLRLSYITILISLKWALKCSDSVEGPYNPTLCCYFAELYEDFFCLLVLYLQNKFVIHFLLETIEVRGGSSEDGVFVILIYPFPILHTCFEVSRSVTVLSSSS